MACQSETEGHLSTVKQWAHRVVRFSSEYNDSTWSANMALGEPRVWPQHGDIHGAWASGAIDSNQFIELEYEVPVHPTAIRIYETFNPGGVVAIKALHPQGHWDLLWSTDKPVHLTSSRIFSPPLKSTTKTKTIRLEVDCSAAGTYCEIDAVQLEGIQVGAVRPDDDTVFIENLKSLVNQRQFSDVQLLIEGNTVYAHKGILAARSSYFRQQFEKDNTNKFEIDLENISKEDFVVALTYIYTNRLPHELSFQCLVSLCRVSSHLEIRSLKAASIYRLLEIMKHDNVAEIFSLIQNDQDLGDLSSICLDFMADHLKDMCKVPAFETLHQSTIIKVMQKAIEKLNMKCE